MKRLIILSALSAALFVILSATSNAQDKKIEVIDFGTPETLTITSEGNQNTFLVEIADNEKEQARGLMYRDVLDPDKGMLFEFEKPKVATIWMKNTGIPLDILFIRSNGKILKIEHSATPYSLRSASSEGTVAAVVELAGGRALELGIMPGDMVTHGFFGNAGSSEEK